MTIDLLIYNFSAEKNFSNSANKFCLSLVHNPISSGPVYESVQCQFDAAQHHAGTNLKYINVLSNL